MGVSGISHLLRMLLPTNYIYIYIYIYIELLDIISWHHLPGYVYELSYNKNSVCESYSLHQLAFDSYAEDFPKLPSALPYSLRYVRSHFNCALSFLYFLTLSPEYRFTGNAVRCMSLPQLYVCQKLETK